MKKECQKGRKRPTVLHTAVSALSLEHKCHCSDFKIPRVSTKFNAPCVGGRQTVSDSPNQGLVRREIAVKSGPLTVGSALGFTISQKWDPLSDRSEISRLNNSKRLLSFNGEV
jgi:hypothetical protein